MTGRRDDPNSRANRRRAAKAAGLRTYDPGFPCKYEHAVERFTSSDECVECDRLRKLKESPEDLRAPLGHLLADWTPVVVKWERRA